MAAVRISRRLLAAGIAALAVQALADDWPGPQTREVFSESREFFVRVIPGRSLGDTYGFRGMQKGPYATAEFYHRGPDRSYRLVAETTLRNPMAPVDFFVSNDGRLVTLDNWHNLGYGRVVAIYDGGGREVRSYELAELFPTDEIQGFEKSMSSLRWRTGPAYIRGDQKTLLVTVQTGGDFLFGLETGDYKYCEYKDRQPRCRNSLPPKKTPR